MRKRKPDPRQTAIDWTRARQLRILQTCTLPRSLTGDDGRGVRATTAKAILSTIDHHGRGRTAWLSHETIARETNCCERTSIRAIYALERIGALIVEVDGRRACNRYTIVWSELATLCAEELSEPTATVSEPTATVSEPTATGGSLNVLKAHQETPPPTPATDTAANRADDTERQWAAAEELLAGTGYELHARLISEARDKGLTVAQFRSIVETYTVQQRRFDGPQAMCFRVRTGSWPVAGVLDVERVHQVAAATQQKRGEADKDRKRYAIIRAGRQRGESREVIAARLAAEGLEW